ncbi:MAG: hypothetical protein ABEJ93_03035 [Candidatus Nanohalobium sp.]
MSMSLDYMGKLVITLVVIGAVVGMISNFRSQIKDTAPDPGTEEDPGLEIIQISAGHSGSVSKVASLITLCYQKSLEKGYKDISCFVARKESGSFNIDKSGLKSQLKKEVQNNTKFKTSTFNRDSLVINYRVRPGKVVVEQ